MSESSIWVKVYPTADPIGNEWARVSGGTVTTYTKDSITYEVHTFTANDTLTVETRGFVDVLVVGGGGAGASSASGTPGVNWGGGGGGAGGLIERPFFVEAGTYPVGVGAGGAGTTSGLPSNGGDSYIGNLVIAAGGGAGAGHLNGTAARPSKGGSGGGGCDQSNANWSAEGIIGNGYAGGTGFWNGNSGTGGGGGGGGASAAGGTASASTGGAGGAGISSSITGSPLFYAGGGGGRGANAPAGGSGVGGAGVSSGTAGNGTANRGGGGGGTYNGGTSGSGGSGIVIVRTIISGGTESGIVASGGTESEYVGDGTDGVLGQRYRVHTFTTVGADTLTVTQGGVVDVLLVGGGGQGCDVNLGGGAGGVLLVPSYTLSPGDYPAVVGAGGAYTFPVVNNGGDSTFGPFTAVGGSYGLNNGPVRRGGSTGAGSTQALPVAGQGYRGHNGEPGGGGGAGGIGTAATEGPGVTVFGTMYGKGGHPSTVAAPSANTGNGGNKQSNGGSGVVVVRYPIAG
jgi:hypothetical protein